ncbi:hypothetical protein F4678DRAFT_482914 [Xylaria arbuscula]|nr:hypothetical protein F4678DRAFT_482914 [Xylaria arbuscula]
MFSVLRLCMLVGFLGLSPKSANGGALHHYPTYNTSGHDTATVELPTTYYETYPPETVTIIAPPTVITTSIIRYLTTTLNWTVIVSVPETVIVTSTTRYSTTIPITNTTTVIVPTTIPTTDTTTVVVPITNTTTVVVPTTDTTTDTATVTVRTTDTDTVVVPTTITPPVSYSTLVTTIATPEPECPTTCSLVATTVRLFFWPTAYDYTYPSTYVETSLDYTFTSPSVYLLINTIYGTNSLGRAGPSATNEVFPLDLDEVSTIVPGEQITRQLTLNDLHTNCPQSEAPEVIATAIPDGHCDFSLVAPPPVKSWASPCGACGRLGLFDPPYAIPPLGGGIIPITTTDVGTTTFASTVSASSGPTSTIVTATTTGVTSTTETSIASSAGDSTINSSQTTADGSSTTETAATSSADSTTGVDSSISETATVSSSGTVVGSSTGDPTTVSSDPTGVPTASASRMTGICGAAWLLVASLIIFYL